MSLTAEYRASLKSVAVEEPIDLWLHRPLAFLLAKASLKTPITPNQLTVVSMLLGVLSGLAMSDRSREGECVAAGLLFLSAVVDCSDGMLARMRGRGSELGRMLDGVADSITLLFGTAGALYVMTERFRGHLLIQSAVLLLTMLTVYTTSWHTSGYDHYKNLYLRLTVPGNREGEDLENAVVRWDEARRGEMGLALRVVFPIYLNYLRAQRRLIAWFDPRALVRLDDLPVSGPTTAAVFAKHMLPPLRIWRAFFGVGSLVFGLALSVALGHPEVFLLYRLLVLNALFLVVLRPMQRRASEAAFRALGMRPLGLRGERHITAAG